MRKLTVLSLVAVMAAVASADVLDRPTGIKIGQRMTLRPYVSMSVSYDSSNPLQYSCLENSMN